MMNGGGMRDEALPMDYVNTVIARDATFLRSHNPFFFIFPIQAQPVWQYNFGIAQDVSCCCLFIVIYILFSKSSPQIFYFLNALGLNIQFNISEFKELCNIHIFLYMNRHLLF